MEPFRADEQPIARTVGRRVPPPPGVVPSRARRDAPDLLSRHATCTPKGVYRYASHEAMDRDRERWSAEAMARAAAERA